MENITINDALNLMMTKESIVFYESYEGLEVNSTYIVPDDGELLTFYMNTILMKLPFTKLVTFEYKSRFACECNMEEFQGVPSTLKKLILATFEGITIDHIKYLNENDIECHHQNEENFADDEEDIIDDSGKYVLKNGKWLN